jgi:hypothetical protein
MRPFNLFQIEGDIIKVLQPSKPSLYYQKYKNGQFSTKKISLTTRDIIVFDIPLERAQKT